MQRREGVIGSIQSQHRDLQSMNLVIQGCLLVVVLTGLIAKQLGCEARIKLANCIAL